MFWCSSNKLSWMFYSGILPVTCMKKCSLKRFQLIRFPKLDLRTQFNCMLGIFKTHSYLLWYTPSFRFSCHAWYAKFFLLVFIGTTGRIIFKIKSESACFIGFVDRESPDGKIFVNWKIMHLQGLSYHIISLLAMYGLEDNRRDAVTLRGILNYGCEGD